MSLCLHFCEQYKVRHSQTAIANWQQEALNNVLEALVEKVQGDLNNFWYSHDCIDYSDTLEIQKTTVNTIIDLCTKAGDEWGDIFPDDVQPLQTYLSTLGQADITPRTLAEFLITALANSEPSLDYIRFEWI